MRRLVIVSLLLISGLQTASADLDVQARSGLVTIRARAAPLEDVLARLSRATGLRVIYEGRPPSHLVTVNFEGLAEAETLSRLLEGSGCNYAFQVDASGRRVETLIVSGLSAPATAPGTPARAPAQAAASRPADPLYTEETTEPDEEQPDPRDVTATVPEFVPPSPGERPGLVAPGMGPTGLPGPISGTTPPASVLSPPSGMGPTGVPGPASVPSPPSFPGEASGPVPYPAFPPVASNPAPR